MANELRHLDDMTPDEIKIEHRQLFEEKLREKINNGKIKKVMLKQQYMEVLDKVRNVEKDCRRDHYNNTHYSYASCENVLFLREKNEKNRRFLYMEEMFDVLYKYHTETGHGRRDKMSTCMQVYANGNRSIIELFLDACRPCIESMKNKALKHPVKKPIISYKFNQRGQMDLINMCGTPDRNYKWILVYQDNFTKFIYLRPLISKQAAEVGMHLYEIFSLQGAPNVLQSDNGTEFIAAVIQELIKLWPNCSTVTGSPRHPRTQGSVERANADIGRMLQCWMQTQNCSKWALGLITVQRQKNSSFHSALKKSPAEVLYGRNISAGIHSIVDIPADVLKNMNSEVHMNRILTVLGHENLIDKDENEMLSENDNETTEVVDNNADIIQEFMTEREEMHEEVACHLDMQADGMLDRSEAEQPELKVGDNVSIPLEGNDKHKNGNRENIIGIIVKITDGRLKIANKQGTIHQTFQAHEVRKLNSTFLTEEDVNTQIRPLRTVCQPRRSQHGIVKIKCLCSTKCIDPRCRCIKNNVKCTTQCHKNGKHKKCLNL